MEPTEKKVEEVIIENKVEEKDLLTLKDEEILKLREERDNYKAAALQRKGRLPADSEVLGEDFDLFVEEKVKTILADKEISRREQEKTDEIRRMQKENAELRLAFQNRPGGSMGGSGSGSSVEVKDNVFSSAQIDELTKRAKRIGADPVKFIESAKGNLTRKS